MTIDEYLDDLYARLPRDPRVARRTLDEAADHLHTAADDLEAGGLDRDAAEAEAVRRFGAAAPLARAATRRALRRLGVNAVCEGSLLVGIGLVAIGFSGVIAWIMNAWYGFTFVGGPGQRSTMQVVGAPARDVQTISSFGRPWEAADDAVSLRLLAGAVGVVVLAVAWFLRRGAKPSSLPTGVSALIAASAFGGATAVLGAASVDQWVQHGAAGVGYYLSGAIVAAVGFAVSGVRAVRVLLAR